MKNIVGYLVFMAGMMIPMVAMSETNQHDDIITQAKKTSSGLGSFKDFSTTGTPCRVVSPGFKQSDSPRLRVLLAKAGMKVTTDDVPCHIVIHGFVTMPNGDGKSVTPVNAEFLLANQENIGAVGPAIQNAESSAEQATKPASAMSGVLSPGEQANIIQAGNAIGNLSGAGGTAGSLVGMLAGLIADIAGGVSARNNTPPGVANIKADLRARDGFLPPAQGFDIYAASTRAGSPSDLLRAAVSRFVAEIAKVEADAKTEAGISLSTADNGTAHAQ